MKRFLLFLSVAAACLLLFTLTAAISQIRELVPDFYRIDKGSNTAVFTLEAEALYSDMVKSFITREGGQGSPDFSEFYHDGQVVLSAKASSYINAGTMELTYLMDDSSLALLAEVSICGKTKLFSAVWTVSRKSMLTGLLRAWGAYPEDILKYPELEEIMNESFLPRDYNLFDFFEGFSVSHDHDKVKLSGKLKIAQLRIVPVDENSRLPGTSYKMEIRGNNRYRRETLAEAEKFLADCGLVPAKENAGYTMVLTLDNPVKLNIKQYSSSGTSFRAKGTYELKDRNGKIYAGYVSEAAFHVSKKEAECKSSIKTARSAVKECVEFLVRNKYSAEY